jgi:hypothetical protein
MKAHLGQAPAEQHEQNVWCQGDDEQASSTAEYFYCEQYITQR